MIFDLQKFYGEGGAEQLVFLEGRIPFPEASRSVKDPEFARQAPDQFDLAYFKREAPTFHELLPIIYTFADEPKGIDYFRKSLRQAYESLPHHPLVTRILDDSRARIRADAYIGLHVRRGDIIDLLRMTLAKLDSGDLPRSQLASALRAYVGRTTLYNSYYAAIEEAIEQRVKIVFFSDSPETYDHFVSRFGARNFINGDRFVKPRYPIQKAFIDFNLLVGASRIIGTGGSIFSSFAAMLGSGCYVNVAGVETLESMENNLYNDCLVGLEIGAASRGIIHAEMSRQYAEVVSRRQSINRMPDLPLK